jgi:hypothetical protein
LRRPHLRSDGLWIILPFTIKINVKSVNSLYKIMPSKGVNFGAVLYNTSKQRTFDIVNNCVFDFQFKIVDWDTPPDAQAALVEVTPAAVDPKAKGAPPAKAAAAAAAAGSASLTMGAFLITLASGIIAPGSSAQRFNRLLASLGETSSTNGN